MKQQWIGVLQFGVYIQVVGCDPLYDVVGYPVALPNLLYSSESRTVR